MRRVLAVVLVTAISISLAACGSDAQRKSTSTTKKAAKSTTTSTVPFVSNAKNTPATLRHFVGAKDDVHDTKCAPHNGWWTARGKVTNSSTHRARYRIYVSFLKADTTVGLAQVDVPPMRPHATRVWVTSVKVAQPDLRCILRVERSDI